MKSKAIAFTIADHNNLKYARMMRNSLRKFHTEEELPLHIVQKKELNQYLSDDPQFFYRATPVVAQKYINDYDLVLKLDADQIIMGNLNHIIDIDDYDVGTVLNINRVDPQRYGQVDFQGIHATKYYNCGLVAMRSKKFIDHWHKQCYTKKFHTLRYREQDILNAILHYGDYNVRCFDHYDEMRKIYTWNGLVCKGEGLRMEVQDGEVILPVGPDGYPDKNITIKAYHFAGGKDELKMHYRTTFNEQMVKHLDYLVSDEKTKTTDKHE